MNTSSIQKLIKNTEGVITVISKDVCEFDVKEDLVDYIKNTENTDLLIIESAKEFIKNKDIHTIEFVFRVKGVESTFVFVYKRCFICDILNDLMDDCIKNEFYEKCIEIKILLEKL